MVDIQFTLGIPVRQLGIIGRLSTLDIFVRPLRAVDLWLALRVVVRQRSSVAGSARDGRPPILDAVVQPLRALDLWLALRILVRWWRSVAGRTCLG